VEAINGVRSDAEKNHWWYFQVNGHRSNVAAERYLVKPGDRITWMYLAAPRRASTKPSQDAKATCPLPARP
jgi:Domain of unknown function (DUF4430)